MRLPVIILTALGMTVAVFFSLPGTDHDLISLFTQANTHYRHSEYSQAIEKYEEIIASGSESGPVYYNLANAYYRNGEKGKAVLNYERALRFMPRDSDLNYNYRFITKRLPYYETQEQGVFSRLINKHIRFYSLRESGLILLCLIAATGVLWIAGLMFSWPVRRLRYASVFFGVIFFVYLLGVIFRVQYDSNRAVMVTSAEARFEPKVDATTHYEILEGEQARIITVESRWVKISRPDGKMGWVEKKHIERI